MFQVAECRLATWVLARAVGQPFLGLEKVKQLHLALGVGVEEMLALVETHIHKEPYTAAEVRILLDGIKTEKVEQVLESWKEKNLRFFFDLFVALQCLIALNAADCWSPGP